MELTQFVYGVLSIYNFDMKIKRMNYICFVCYDQIYKLPLTHIVHLCYNQAKYKNRVIFWQYRKASEYLV